MNHDYLGPKRYENQFDMTEGIKKYYPHLIKKTLKAEECDCGTCTRIGCTCMCHVPGFPTQNSEE